MFITEYINIYIFLVSLCIGLLYTYFITPEPLVVVKYPTPFNVGNVIYTDNTGTCYRYNIERTKCNELGKKVRIFKPQ
jgi:hypothetical protein